MAGNEHHHHHSSSSSLTPSSSPSSRHTTIPLPLPPRAFSDSLFSPGPMTPLSNFLSDSEDCNSFSQLLAGALSSPSPAIIHPPNFSTAPPPPPVYTMSPPLNFLDSPGLGGGGLFSPQGHFGMTHHKTLAQVTSLTSSNFHVQQENPKQEPFVAEKESRESAASASASAITVDKPADDGYNWRKYGQKQVKGSEFPRSYYKCTQPNCIVKKKVERSFDGQVTEIIYKGQHNHGPPQNSKRRAAAKDGDGGGNSIDQGNADMGSQSQSVNMMMNRQGTSGSEQVSGTSDSEAVGDENDEDEPDPKRRSKEERGVVETVSSHRTVMEPRIVVQTNSEVDILDDGYRWRKYGQKVVKGNPYPRSYYKCTAQECKVRKHVERAAADRRAVITTYEGKHNHDVPDAKTSNHNSGNASRWKPHGVQNNAPIHSNNRQPIAHLRLKEEQIT